MMSISTASTIPQTQWKTTGLSLTDARHALHILTGILSTVIIKYATHIYNSHSVKDLTLRATAYLGKHRKSV